MNKRREILMERAKEINLELDYKPMVIMDDIRKLPNVFWHKNRTSGFGGSDEGVLNGLSKYKTIEELAFEKTIGLKSEMNRDKQFTCDFGHVMESPNLKLYAAIKGYKFITYKKYFLIVETKDNPTDLFPDLEMIVKDVYVQIFDNDGDAKCSLFYIKEHYSNAYILEQETDEPKDIREITQEEHDLYDAQGYVCVDRRQYRHPLYPSMIGDLDGLCVTPDGTKIGIESKTYSHQFKGSYASGIYGDTGKVKNPEYILQVRHYMAVLNIDQFDIIATCGNTESDFTITTVYRNADIEKEICANCEKVWFDIQNGNVPMANNLSSEQYDSLVRIYTTSPMVKERIDLPLDYQEIVEDYQKLKEVINEKKDVVKNLEEKQKAISLQIIKEMDNCEEAYLETDTNSYLITNKIPKASEGVDVDRLKLNYPDVFQECKKYSDPKASFKIKQVSR